MTKDDIIRILLLHFEHMGASPLQILHERILMESSTEYIINCLKYVNDIEDQLLSLTIEA